MLNKSMKIAAALCCSTLIFTGCGDKTTVVVPEEKPVVKTPADLKLLSRKVFTGTKEATERYDLQVNIDNTDNAASEIMLKNVGEEPLEINNVVLVDDTKLFRLVSLCDDTIAPKESCTLKVSFDGKYAGRYTSYVKINTNSKGTYVGREAKVHVVVNAKNRLTGIINPVAMQAASAKKPMTKLNFDISHKKRYATIVNNGYEDISIRGMKFVGADQASFSYSHECPSVLKPKESCELEVNYTPNMKEDSLSYLVVDSDGILSPSNIIRLQGFAPMITNSKMPEILRLAFKDNMNVTIGTIKENANTYANQEFFLEDFKNVNSTYYFRTMYQRSTDPKLKEYFDSMVKYYFEKNNFKVVSEARNADKILNIYPKFYVSKTTPETMSIESDIAVSVVTKSDNDSNTTRLGYEMKFDVSNYSDEYFVYAIISDKLNSFLFNLLGLED
jgi:hypothetical protein